MTPAQAMPRNVAADMLRASAQLWFLVAAAGQFLFVAYIVGFYGRAVLENDIARWGKVLPHAYVSGDFLGNLTLASHLLLAAMITFGGPLQLIPQLRARLPRVHHWIGRGYIASAVVMSVSGLYLSWFRDGVGSVVMKTGGTLNALLILLCAAMAVRYAMARKLDAHRRWALRLFLVVSGVWFFRLGLMSWLIVNGGPAGFDPETFRGPFLNVLSYSQTLVPLTVLEFYLRAQAHTGPGAKFAVASGIFACTGVTALGIVGVTMMLWLPRL